MEKICINGRDELLMLDLDKVACFKADTDYTIIYYLSGLTTTVALGLNKIERLIADVPTSATCDFVRVGRSHIVNQPYLYQIQILQQKLILSDGDRKISLSVTREALKRYKMQVAEKHTSGSSKNPRVSS